MFATTLNGNPLYVKGTMDVKGFDPATNNMVYYSNKVSTSQLQSTINLGAVNAGPGNPVVIQIPDSPSLTLNLTTADFSLEGRALASGSNITYGGVVPVDEVAEASGTALTVSQTPVAPLGGCDIVGMVGNDGTAYSIDPATRQLQGFTAEDGQQYCVHYWTTAPSAKQFSVDTLMNPAIVRIFITLPVYATDGAGGSGRTGSRVGSLYITIPRMQFNGDVSTDGSQTTPATTVMNGTALSYNEACEAGISCGSQASPKLAYMVLELYGNPDQNVKSLVVVGGAVDLTGAGPVQIPVKYVMDDGTLMTPLMSNLIFSQSAGSKSYFTVNDTGTVTGIADGEGTVTAASRYNASLTTTAEVTVTGIGAVTPTANVTFSLTEPTGAGNTLTGGGADKTIAVQVAAGASSVVITGAKTAAQTVAVSGANASDVTAGGTDTAPTYTVDTSPVAAAGGDVDFSLTVTESGKGAITYTVKVTVAAP